MFYPMQSVLRLCRRRNAFQNKRYNHVQPTHELTNKLNSGNKEKAKDFQSLFQENQNKITFSSYLEHEKVSLGYFKYHLKTQKKVRKEEKKTLESRSLPPLPVSLRYYVEDEHLLEDNSEEKEKTEPNELEKEFHLPLSNTTQVEYKESNEKPSNNKVSSKSSENEKFDRSKINKWMINYEHFDDTKLAEHEEDEEKNWSRHYGSPDPSLGISRVPCGGCGALLHSSDPAIPGYLPCEILRHRSDVELRTMECQRCHFLKEYNIALDVTVHPDEYEKLLKSIR